MAQKFLMQSIRFKPIRAFKKSANWAVEMAQWVKVLAINPDEPEINHRTNIAIGEA